jgi:hypothetical protein
MQDLEIHDSGGPAADGYSTCAVSKERVDDLQSSVRLFARQVREGEHFGDLESVVADLLDDATDACTGPSVTVARRELLASLHGLTPEEVVARVEEFLRRLVRLAAAITDLTAFQEL